MLTQIYKIKYKWKPRHKGRLQDEATDWGAVQASRQEVFVQKSGIKEENQFDFQNKRLHVK